VSAASLMKPGAGIRHIYDLLRLVSRPVSSELSAPVIEVEDRSRYSDLDKMLI
jgi:hypothetical protein